MRPPTARRCVGAAEEGNVNSENSARDSRIEDNSQMPNGPGVKSLSVSQEEEEEEEEEKEEKDR